MGFISLRNLMIIISRITLIFHRYVSLEVSKKIKKSIKPRKLEKNNQKNQTVKKNRLNRLKFWENQPVRFGFGFISLKLKKPNRIQTGKTEPNWKKTSQTGKNRAKLVWTDFCPKKPNWNWSVWTGFDF